MTDQPNDQASDDNLWPYVSPVVGTVQVQEIERLATRAGTPKEIEGGKIYVVVAPPDGEVKTINLDTDEYRRLPKRKTGTYTTSTAEAFVDYLAKHSIDETEIWASADGHIVAVIDAHGISDPGWGQHRVKLTLQKSPEWIRWTATDRKAMTQADFAELVEDRLIDIIDPPSADMLEVAQTFEAKTNVRFASSTILASGERQLEYKEDVEAQAGRSGRLTVPHVFTLALRPFMGGEAFKVEARFRYRIREGTLSISYALNRPEDIVQTAFDQLCANIATAAERPLYAGTPA